MLAGWVIFGAVIAWSTGTFLGYGGDVAMLAVGLPIIGAAAVALSCSGPTLVPHDFVPTWPETEVDRALREMRRRFYPARRRHRRSRGSSSSLNRRRRRHQRQPERTISWPALIGLCAPILLIELGLFAWALHGDYHG